MPRNYSIQDTIEMEKQKLLVKNKTEIISSDINLDLSNSNTLSVDTTDTFIPDESVEHESFFRKLFKWTFSNTNNR